MSNPEWKDQPMPVGTPVQVTGSIEAPGGDAPAKFSAMQRILGVFFNPTETFTDIARKPAWVLPVALSCVLGLCFAWVMNQRVDWASFIRAQAEKNPRFAQMSDEQKQQALAPQVKMMPAFTYVFGAIGSPVFSAIIGGILMVAFNAVAGSGIKFRQAFGLTTHCFLTGLVSGPLAMISMWFRKFGDVTPENMLASNVAAFLSSDAPKALHVLGQALDVFNIWVAVLLALAFSAANPKKAPTGKAMGIVFGLWAFWVLVRMGWAAAFS